MISTALGTTAAAPLNTSWYVSGLGAGTVGSVVFSDIEHLVGADDNEDVFIFGATGGLTGHVEGGARGFDTVVLNGGSFDTVTYKAVNGNDGSIARDSNLLVYTGFEPLVDKTEGGNRIIETSDRADNIKVSREGGKIKIESTDSFPTFEHVILDFDPASLTIKTGADRVFDAVKTDAGGNPVLDENGIPIVLSGADNITIESLVFAGDLILETGSMSRMADTKDSITFAGNLDLQGKKLVATAETIKINDGVTIKTSNPGGTAGEITLNSWKTTVSTNAKLLAEGTTAGDITINALDTQEIFTPLIVIEIKDVGITVGAGAEIKGDDVKLIATADSRTFFNTDDFSVMSPSTWGAMAGDLGLGILEGLLGAVAVSKSTAAIDVQTGSTINAKGDFEARASSYVNPIAAPATPFLAIGIALTDTTVTIGGNITAGGNAAIVALGDHTVNVVADAMVLKGVAPSAAISVIDSDVKAQVTDDATLTVGGSLVVQGSTVDRNRTMARSTGGKDGDVALAIAVTVENGRTEALLDGSVNAGSVEVEASMLKEVVPIKQLFVVPSLGNGTAAIAGVGSDSKGDLLDDTKAEIMGKGKAGISAAFSWVKEKFTGPASEKTQEEGKPTKNNARSFDAAAAIAVVVDTNIATARIGDGNADGDSKNGSVVATGEVSVLASVRSRPDITAASSAATNPEAKNTPDAATKFGGSLAVAVGVYSNDADAMISELASVNSDKQLTVAAEALNEIDPLGLWGVNLISPFLSSANYDTTQGTKTVAVGEIVDVKSGHAAGGDSGSWYKFKGDTSESIDLGAEDFSVATRWEDLGNPVKYILLDKWLPTAATYLNDNLGLDGNLVDSWSMATAEGQKTAIAGAVTVVDFNQSAEAVIKSGAKINQLAGGGPVTTNGDQHVVVEAASTSHLVNLGGNIKLPGITGTKNSFKPAFSAPGLGSKAAEGGDAVGATVMVFDLDNTTLARIEDGVKLAADSLQVTADTFVVNAALGASGGESDDFGLNGAFIVSLVDNTTRAHIENGAALAIGNKAVADPNGKGASVFVDAQDKTYVVTVSGGVATSEHIGVGMSAGVNLVTRNTEAVIGNLHDKSSADTRGTITSLGDIRLNARNEGFAGTVAVAGAKVSQKSSDPTATSGPTGMKQSDGTSTDDPGKLPNNQSNYDKVLSQLMGILSGGSSSSSDGVGSKQGKSGIAVAGAATVSVVEDNARAYLHEVGVLTATGKSVLLNAANDTHIGSLAGGVAMAGDRSSASTDVAIAGAFGGNFISGTTSAFLDDATSISANTLTIGADRSGYIVSLTAGVSGATGRNGIAVGGSVSVTMTDYTTETGLSNTTGTIAGNLTLASTDDTNIILVAGSAGFGGKAGVGAAVAFTQIDNTTRSTIDSVTDLKHGGLSVTAVSGGLIVAVTGSAGVGTGGQSGGGAGTVTINRIANTTEARILNSTFHKDSTGNINISATDNSFIFSFAGAFGAGKTAGLGVAAAVNLLDNTLRAYVEDSTLVGTGTLDITAEQTGTLVSVALGVGSGQQFAGAGSITVNIIDNTIEAGVWGGSDVKVDGAIDISASDSSVSVSVSGGAAFGKTAAVGAAFSGNFIENTVTAKVDDSLVESTGSTASVGAQARAVLVSVAIGGAGGDTFALGGSIAVNQVENTIEASITDANGAGTGKASLLKANGDIAIAAADSTTMVVVAGGLAIANTAAIGVSASTTQIQNKVHAWVDNTEITSTTGKVSLTAGFKPPDTDVDLKAISLGTTGIEMPETVGSQIVNIAVGVAGSGTFAGGGAFSLNWIRNDVKAYAAGGAKVTAAGDITIAAFDDPEIDSFAIGGGIGTGTGGGALGLSYNYIGGDPGNPSRDIPKNPNSANVGKAIANVNASTVTSTGGSVSVLAGTTPRIINATIAGSGGGNVAVGGAFSINFIRSIVDASVTGNSNVTALQDVKVGASATPVMITIAGNVNISFGAAGIGVASATNDMQSKITATIDGSRVKATNGDIIVDAAIGQPTTLPTLDTDDVPVDAQIWTLAVAGSGAGNAAIAGSLSLNWIRNDVQARISNVGNIDAAADEISAGGKISVTAKDASTINGIAGAISVALSSGSGAAGAAVAYNYLGGDPDSPTTTDNNKVTAKIENVTGQLKAGSIEVKAGYTGSVNNITLGGAGAQNFALGGSVSINKIRNTADAHISGSTGVSTTSGNVTIEATDTSTIRALAGGVGIALAPGGGVAAAIGISAADNHIENTTKAYIDGSKITSAAGLALTADSKQTIQTLTIGGALGVSGGDGVALTAAGAGSGNTVKNQVLAYISNSGGANEIKANNGAITLTAKDESKVQAASGAVAISVAIGSTAAGAASIGISASDNDIDNTIKAYIDASKVTATNGNVELKATENATIEALAVGGSVSGAGGLIGGGAFAGAGAGSGNTIDNTVQAAITGSSTVSTVTSGAVLLTASDTSKINVDSGGVALTISGGIGGASASIGASVAINKITNTIQAYVDSSTVTSIGGVELSATSTPTIDALSLAGAAAITAGGGGIAASGAGASSTNTIANTVEAYAKSATMTSQNAAALKLTATETGKIKAETIGGSLAVAAGAVGGAVSIGVALADNDISSAIRAYSDKSTLTSAGALDLKASSSSTAESLSVAASLAVSAAPSGFAFSGGGADSNSRVHTTVEAYATADAAAKKNITAAGLITISATETSNLKADVGVGSVAIGAAGASIGVSVASNVADSTVKAYVDNVNLTSTGGGISILASADDTISKTLGVATSVAISIGGAGAGSEATATVTPNIDAYIGSGAVVKAGDIGITAKSKATLAAETYGVALGALAIGGSVAKATAGGTIKAHVDGVIASSQKVNVLADATQTANAKATALAGGIISGSGAASTATVNPTVKAYGAGSITASDSISFVATATPQAVASALGVSVGVGAVGVSDATASASPNIDANPGGASTVYTAKSFSVSTAINVPVGSYTAKANSTGATGGLIGVNATSVHATTSGHAYSTIEDGSTLVVSDSVSITATGDSKDRAEADSFNIGLIAVGGNVSVAKATVDTRAWLGKEVTISNGTDIGGLTDGGTYYVVLDDVRTFEVGNVDAGNDTIFIGTDHGLKNLDRVTFKATSGGGLDFLKQYSVELVGADRIRLRTLVETGKPGEPGYSVSVDGIVNLTGGVGGTLGLNDPRRVRLATSQLDALPKNGSPIVIDIDATGATGTKHQLTPITGFAASALEFNPATQANSSKETLELPSGHSLITGQAVKYGRSGGAVLTIKATGTDYVHAISESGSGGVIAGAVATASTIVDSKTKAFIEDDTDLDASKTLLRVSKLNISATHTSQYDSELSSIQASLVGYSGGWANNNIKATVEATIGENADIVTQDLQVIATSKSKKDIVSGPNVKSGSGGVFQGNNAESVSNLENRTTAAIGNNASVKVTGSVAAPGLTLLSAYNDTIGDDEVLLDTGGAFVGSGVKSHINVNVNDATAKIGSNATIETVGALDMQTRATANYNVHPQAHTYGLAGGAGVDAGVLINNHNDVSIGDKTTVQALGDVNLLAGKDRLGARNNFKITSFGDDLNATAVPISTLKSHIQLNQNNTVTVGDDAKIRTARDANLIGETLSTADLLAYGSGKNWLTAIAGGIDSLLGAGGSAEKKGGTVEHPQTQTVTVNGLVEVGILKDQELIISKGTGASEAELTAVTKNVGGMKVTTTVESLATNLSVERQRLLKLISDYEGDLESVAAYSAALQQVEQQMFDLGLIVETTAKDKDGKTVTVLSVQEGFNVPYITVDPIHAQSGTIRISGGSVLGDGELKALGNVNVKITNDSPAYLRLRGITIPDNDGGTVRLNGEEVTSIKGFGGTLTSSGDKGSPTITVVTTFKEGDSFAGNNKSPWDAFRTPDLEIAGNIDALQAEVFLKSEGSVLARGNILASKLTIEAGGNFVLTSTDALFHAGGTPASPEGSNPWSVLQSTTEAKGAAEADKLTKEGKTAAEVGQKGSITGGVGSGFLTGLGGLAATALAKASESNIVAANNVVIIAQALNVNGILQAGIAEHKATIDTTFAAKITAAETARTQAQNGDYFSAAATAKNAGIVANESYTVFKLTGPTLKVDDSGLEYNTSTALDNNLPVYYNAESDRLEVSPVRVQGGFMSLTGRILNTNANAQIKVMDGYGQITIKNDLDIPLQINRLDTGAPGKTDQGIEGKLVITDTGNQGLNAQGKLAPLVTEYTRLGSDIERKQYYFVTPGKTPTVLSSGDDPTGTGRQATYTPQSPEYRFYWTTGQDSTRKTYTTYGTSAWLNIDAFSPDPDDVVEGPTVEYATPRALASGNYLALDSTYEPGEPDYTYEFERINTDKAQTKVERRWEESTWYGKTTYYTKTLEWQGQKDIHTHSIRADRPVTINFIGFDQGAVTVNSKGDVQINGEVQNVTGATSITSSIGSIIQANNSVAVGGKSISLSAGNSIGGEAVIRTNLDNDAGGSLSATAANVVRIEEISDDLIVNQVTVNASGDRVELKARSGSILGVAGNLVQGGLVVLDSAGSIGTLGAGGSARTPAGDAMAIRVDTGSTNRDTFTAIARGDIYVHEKAGDLRVVSVDTTDPNSKQPLGNVRLVVSGGRLTDANTLEVKDSRTEAQLFGVWDAMNATESTAFVSIEATARSFENNRTREYDSYWTMRQSQADGGKKYDDKFSVTLSAAEHESFSAYYASQGFTQVEIDEAIQTLENGRTKEYHDLHKTYGKFGDTLDTLYRYGTSITQEFGDSAVDVGANSVTLKGNAFDTGDAVVYHSAGGVITGLVDGQTYYVVNDAVTAGKFRLANSYDDAVKGKSLVDLSGSVTGTAHLFSAADISFAGAAVNNGLDTITLDRHTFQTGQAVVFQSSGTGAIGNLTDGQTYYVVADGSGKLQLAKTHADATSKLPVVIDLGSVSGSGGFVLSEADVLAQKAAWSKSQLLNSFALSVLGPKDTSGTTATKEAANVIGKDVVLDVTTHVGSIEAIVDIKLPGGKLEGGALSDTQKLALAAAERADVTFYQDEAGKVEITEDLSTTSKTVQLIRIVPKADVDVTVKGALTIVSGATVNVGSEETIGIDQVKASQSARIKGQKALTDAKISGINVISGDLILEAEELGIGSSSDRLVLDLNAGATLVARAHDDIYLTENAGDMRLIEVNSTDGDVNLLADGSILDVDTDDDTTPQWNVNANNVTLKATKGSIGTDTNYLEIEVESGGLVHALGNTGVHLHEVTGDMLVTLVKADAGDVRLRAQSSIQDANNDIATDVFGRSITLTADFDTIGGPLFDLEIDSSFGSAGLGSVTTKSGKNVHLVENDGDLRLGTVTVDAGTAFIKAIKGSILDADQDESTANVLSGKVWLLASQDIGESAHRLTTKSGNLEAESTAGSTYIGNSGALEVGGVTGAATAGKAGGSFNLTNGSPILVNAHVDANDVFMHAKDDAFDAGDKNVDNIVVSSGVTIKSATFVDLRAGDDITIEKGAFIDAKTAIILRGDYQPDDVDVNGSTILVEGSLKASSIQMHGYKATDTIVLRPESLIGDTQVFGMGGADKITLDHLPSITTTQMVAGKAVRDTVDLDGGDDADSYVINITGGRKDYIVNINDTGATGDDVVTINATAGNDLFLVREHFVAYLVPETPLASGKQPGPVHPEVERINYNSTVHQLTINALQGDDQFYVDDNSALTTLDGGTGEDFFQFGQVFGSNRVAPDVAPGDEIKTVFTTAGWLSRGVSFKSTALGGDGNDTFQVYSNQAEVRLEGNNDDDTFIVRSFALADPLTGEVLLDQSIAKTTTTTGDEGNDVIQYNVNAKLDIDGGDGFDQFILLGTEFSDNFAITSDGVFGAGQSIKYENVEIVSVDGLEGNDTFFVLGTKFGVATTIAGGHGWDTFNISGDITLPIVSSGFPAGLTGNHRAGTGIQGPLTIDGGIGPQDYKLRTAVILPTETDKGVTDRVVPTTDTESVDELNIFDDGSVTGGVSTLTNNNFRINGMGGDLTLTAGDGRTLDFKGGITYQKVETLEIMLGSRNDALTIEATMDNADGIRGPLTIVHGGGGGDRIIVDGGGGADSPLAIFGDTEQDGVRYSGTAGVMSGQAWQFANPGEDFIDASQADGAVLIYGGGGDDTIVGSAFGDQLAGGSGADTIDARAGDDLVYGDGGFNMATAAVTIPEPNQEDGDIVRTVYVRSHVVVHAPDLAAPVWADTVAPAGDIVDGGEGNDIVIGDLGLVTQTVPESLYNTAGVILVETKSSASGGDDMIAAALGDDIVLGGTGADTINAGDGNNIVIGDNGFVELQSPDGPRLRIASTDFAFGGFDTITTLGGDDIVLGGNTNDTINAGDGDNIVFGDDGEILYSLDVRLTNVTSTSTDANGGADGITTGAGHDIVLGGRSGDVIAAGAGDNVVFGDSGRLQANSLRPAVHSTAHLLPNGTIESTEHGDGGTDTITTLGGYDLVLGGHANDTVNAGDGDNLVFGDSGTIAYATDGRLSSIVSTSTTANGGADNITTGTGQDIVLGGRFGDTIHGGAGNNMVFGDSGQLVADASSSVYPLASHPLPIDVLDPIQPGDGGNDTITTLGGTDLLIGGDGADVIDSGAGDDFVIGDHATFDYANGVVVTITTTDTAIGGDDIIHAGADDDVVIGGTGSDEIDGSSGRDLLLGDSATLDRTSTLGNFRNPRFRALTGTQIYSVAPGTAGTLLIDTSTYYADPRGPAEWGDFQITLLHHDNATAATLYGNDYIAGGADDDTIFGQLGNDVVQGDGSIDFLSGGGRVGAFRDAAGDLQIRGSFEAAGDGHDYIEGGGGTDVLFGNNGQDDIIGGSSTLFSLTTPARRPDAADLIFGGAGTHAGRNDAGDGTAQGHANDADTIVGDNGNIYRLVGVNGAPAGGGGVGTFGGFLTFNYDNYTNALPAVQQAHIVARGVTLIDYTPGGPDFVGQVGPMVNGDIGAADEIHGESGDDTAYGGAGNDVLFGDAQDDDLIGGYGHDWISGGAGDDGILGDDGRIFTSRNGMVEPLSGVATARAQALLVGNGNGTINATVHVTGTLQKDVDLTPFELDPQRDMLFDPKFADDIIFGGLGRDFIHAGAGDDAVSGAEALNTAYLVRNGGLVRSDFNRPNNPGDALDYNETTTMFPQYDANNPMRRILLNANGTLSTNGTGAEFFLNFDPTEGPLVAGSTTARTDGDDIIFGDMGNDWLVGGTGRDHVLAGWGDDLVNLDDDHRTSGGLNNTPDAEASYADITLGGAGRDVLIANTAGDIMVDTNGEFNSFLVPFSKYGPPTVNRAINPALEQFFYSLGKADGADQTLSAPGNPFGGTAARFGEPFGELGLLTPQDEAAGDQHGGPRDPQAGNSNGQADSGTTTTSGGKSNKSSATSTDTSGTTSSLASSTTLTAPTTLTTPTAPTTATAPTSTPSIDWTGKTSDVTLLPWAQGTQAPIGLSVPSFDVDDDDDDLIDWVAVPATAPAVTAPSTTPTLSATKKK